VSTITTTVTNDTILILTSTYPRWEHDSTPGFVADFTRAIAPSVNQVYVLAPHYKAARLRESTGAVHVRRFRYFLPTSAETIAYNGGGVSKIKATPLYAIKLLCFIFALFISALTATLRRRVTIINAHWLIPQGFVGVLVKFLTGRKLVITVHGSDVLALNGKVMRTVKRFSLRHADIVYVNSSVTEAACQSLYQRDYLRIPMGIDIDRYAKATADSALKSRYSLSGFTILFVGRLSEEKGIIYLLEALKQLSDSGATFKALVIGSGPLEQQLADFITRHQLEDVVIMVGWVDSSDLPRYYASADVLVGPSLHEAQGLVFLEALATGLPVITTDQGGMIDFITNGENGLIVPARDPAALQSALQQLIDNPALLADLRVRAAPSVSHEYAWETVAMRYIKSWRELNS
jgi:glycosyltransferase involved in cell wall biosynthesis